MDKFEKIRKVLEEYSKKKGKGIYKTANMSSNLSWLRIKEQLKEIAGYFPKNAKVLDIGCGRGHNTLMLKLIRPDIKIVGINPEPAKLWKYFKRKDCDFKIGNALKLKFKKNTFDVVVSFGVMEHLEQVYVINFGKREFKNEELRFMQEIFRVLKSGGINIITNLPSKYSWSEIIAGLYRIRSHFKKYGRKDIEKLIKKSDFKKVIIKREYFIPSQVYKVSRLGSKFLGKYYRLLDNIDKCLNKTPLNILSQSYFVVCKKDEK